MTEVGLYRFFGGGEGRDGRIGDNGAEGGKLESTYLFRESIILGGRGLVRLILACLEFCR